MRMNRRQKIQFSAVLTVLGAGLSILAFSRRADILADALTPTTTDAQNQLLIAGLAGVAVLMIGACTFVVVLVRK